MSLDVKGLLSSPDDKKEEVLKKCIFFIIGIKTRRSG
jgi:hypothetical protein